MTVQPGVPKFCSHCGHGLMAGEKFCGGCGTAIGPDAVAAPASQTHHCAPCGDGGRLPAGQNVCFTCRRLRPLSPDYHMPIDYLMWDLDAAAMRTLRNSGPLNAAAQAISQRLGRPWLEAAVNGIRLGPDQMPDIFNQAVLAARIVGLAYLPELYVSGEQMWDCVTLGDENGAFIAIGSVLLNFGPREMLYLLGREMGHVAAGHAMWNTVSRFMSGQSAQRTIMGEGVMQFINPAKIVESAIDAPLMAWARQSQITADRAGAMVVGDPAVVRNVTLQWAMKSFPVLKKLNVAALERQVADAVGGAHQMAEMTMGSQPFLMRRLRLQAEFSGTSDFSAWRRVIDHWLEAEKPKKAPEPPIDDGHVRLTCIACSEPLRFDRSRFANETDAIKVRCPNAACRKVLEVRPAPPKSAKIERLAPEQDDNSLKIDCAACHRPLRVLKAALAGKSEAKIRCPNADCRTVLTVRPPPERDNPDLYAD
ncbi:peptidase M48, Ste24p [Asticcacaulis biprosthecium C19]|uniref:Peptidase M48, Ste24p n=1 Tax=Asticcacaulis biprosthecium C19 TaxID=715226 RepID=F4QGR2_9CAUL|nr:M48 family metalloprotease [Asticcacaulis biprosthecium]EGF92514.1 peptidase M48, Ste24p [Asticcacaulis biprosthecium C19]